LGHPHQDSRRAIKPVDVSPAASPPDPAIGSTTMIHGHDRRGFADQRRRQCSVCHS
jgi:hypothetical protein